MIDSDPFGLVEYLVAELSKRGILFIEMNEGCPEGKKDHYFGKSDKKSLREHFKGKFKGVWIANN